MNKKLFVLLSLMAILMLATPVFAQGEPAAAAAGPTGSPSPPALPWRLPPVWPHLDRPMLLPPPAKVMARNPAARAGIQLAMILGLAFIESLVLFTLVVVFAKVVK